MRVSWLMACALGLAPAAHAYPLSFADAVAAAGRDAPIVEARIAAARAAERAIGPAAQLPDPELVLGLENVPVEGPDAYRLDRDFMTMRSIGIMQEMPSGAERSARRAIRRADLARAEANIDIARLEARLGAARAWINRYYAERRIAVLQRIAGEARAGVEAARARLAGGAGGVDAAIETEVEAARIEDEVADAQAAVLAARAELRRWIGDAAEEDLAFTPPQFTLDDAQLRVRLPAHPALAAYGAETAAAEAELRMARAERMPDWSWSLMYQNRDDAFGDMASVEVRVGLPLFQPWRQGPLIEARRADRERAAAERRAGEREYAAALDAALSQYAAAGANLDRARETRLPLARRRAEAASGAFAAGTMTAPELIVARRAALEAEMNVLDLEERRALIGASLTLQFAETNP
ncbi:MAG: TolC family protein [Hyphomonadaceae bacterium]